MSEAKLCVEVTFASVRRLVESDDIRGSVLEQSTWPWLERQLKRVISAGTEERETEEVNEEKGSRGMITPIMEKNRELGLSMETIVRREVFKYVQVKDRYTALVSILLKSRCYHQSATADPFETAAEAASTANDSGMALVLLPRTPHGKPYIPMRPSIGGLARLGLVPLPCNVSHQYPVVGIARLSSSSSSALEQSTRLGIACFSDLQLGLDVVMFDPYPPRLYDSAVEFVEAFRDKLTREEWDRLMGLASDDGTQLLREFYLHWAMKEAYTKAIGVGLGYDFSSLCVTLENLDRADANMTSTRNYGGYFVSVVNSRAAPALVPATVHLLAEDRTENWRVALHPIFQHETNREPHDGSSGPRTLHDVAGCLCVFVGPLANSSDSDKMEFERDVKVDWLDLRDLIHFHT